MTIWELLDGLEAELGRLRSRLAELESQVNTGGQLQFSLGVAEPKKQRTKRRAAPKKKAKTKHASKKAAHSKNGSQPELPLPPGTAGESKEEPRLLGKRQALGKSLLQLRKASTARLQPVEPEPEPS